MCPHKHCFPLIIKFSRIHNAPIFKLPQALTLKCVIHAEVMSMC